MKKQFIKATVFTVTANIIYFSALLGMAWFKQNTYVPEITQNYSHYDYLETNSLLVYSSNLNLVLLIGLHFLFGYAIFFIWSSLKKILINRKGCPLIRQRNQSSRANNQKTGLRSRGWSRPHPYMWS